MSLTRQQLSRRRSERGSVTIMTAVLLVGLVLVIGLSIDVSRIYMVRSGLQNAADAAALAAARELNSGTGGLTDAVTQAQAAALQANKYGFNRTGITAPNVTISKVEFAPSLDGPWYVGAGGVPLGVETTIKYVRVTTQTASVSILFAVKALGTSHIEQRTAVAGMSVPLNTICNLFPIAVALTPANQNLTNGQQITLTYQDGITGSSAAVNDHSYAVIQVDNDGGGHAGTIQIAAGIPNICASIGQNKTLDSSQSANKKNGRNAISDGANVRFDVYPNGGGGIDPGTYPPDTNIRQGLNSTQYLNKNPLTAPSHTGQDDRRILIMPIIEPLPAGSNPTIRIEKFGAFLLRNKVLPASSCGAGKFCGANLELEYLGNNFVIGSGSYDPNNLGGSTLTIPVLYR